MISFAEPRDITLAACNCQSFAVDNGAFSLWRSGKLANWSGYYEWVSEWATHPGFDWALIPDVIDGDEDQNNALIDQWPSELSWHGVRPAMASKRSQITVRLKRKPSWINCESWLKQYEP